MKIKKLLTCIVSTMCAAVMTLSMVSCGHNSSSESDKSSSNSSSVEVDESKSFTIALYPEFAPESCENFESLVKSGFYDGLTFHRVMGGFMAQGGAYTKSGEARLAPKNVNGEFAANGFTKNTLKHERGTVSMARAQNFNSGSSQFFICYNNEHSYLDGQYAAFGKVTKGMEVVDGFLNVKMSRGSDEVPSVPSTPIVILKAEMIEDDGEGHHQAKFYMQY